MSVWTSHVVDFMRERLQPARALVRTGLPKGLSPNGSLERRAIARR